MDVEGSGERTAVESKAVSDKTDWTGPGNFLKLRRRQNERLYEFDGLALANSRYDWRSNLGLEGMDPRGTMRRRAVSDRLRFTRGHEPADGHDRKALPPKPRPRP